MDSDKINGIACCSHPHEEGSVSCCVQNIIFSLILDSSVNDKFFYTRKLLYVSSDGLLVNPLLLPVYIVVILPFGFLLFNFDKSIEYGFLVVLWLLME